MDSPIPPMPPDRPRRSSELRWLLLVPVALVIHTLLLVYVALPRSVAMDFWALYTGSRVPLTGHSPYEPGIIRLDSPAYRDEARSYYQWTGYKYMDAEKVRTLGQPFPLYYPPQFFLFFTQLARLHWQAALCIWLSTATLIALACGTVVWAFDPGTRHASIRDPVLIGCAFLLAPFTTYMIAMGQSTMILCGAVVLGGLALRRGRPWLASLLWSFCAIKPQAGFELLALTLIVGGWLFSFRVAFWVLLLNVIGGLVVAGDPLMIRGMWSGASQYISVYYNTAQSSELLGWNRVLYVLGGPMVDFTPPRILASHATWMALISASCWIRGRFRWSVPYWVAAGGIGSIACSLSHHYELVLLILIVPYLYWLWDRGYRLDVAFVLAVIGLLCVPKAIGFPLARAAHLGASGTEILLSYRAFLICGLAAYILVRGQPADTRRPEQPVTGLGGEG